ncbi:ABC transporter substrate-binding protein [Hoeflea alexandrii]|nr:ABC transporter substrate-binding protein [Hoeflea alexandrii]MCY0151928.1 ABC transporter substrate-binding protein [Hoeflea alexandrii]
MLDSGAFTIRDWRANEAIVLERNDNYSGDAAPMARAIYRHIPETATQRLLLEQGDIDIARNVGAEEITALSENPDIVVESGVKGSIYYLGLNQKNENLAKPQVRQAMKYLVDYATISDTIMKGKVIPHQAFLPRGFLGALEETPFSLNVEKAKELLAEAGLPDGFTVTMDTRNTPEITAMGQAIQQTMAMARHQDGADPGRWPANADQVPRPQPRHLYRPLGPGLSGSAHQCRYLCPQSRQFR